VTARRGKWARRLGLILGVGLAISAAVISRIPSTGGVLGADVTFLSSPTGELDVSPSGPFVQGLDLRPGSARRPANGSVSLLNQTGSALAVHVRALPSVIDLDEVLRVQLTAGTTDVYTGALGGLRDWTRGFHLEGGQSTELRVSAWIPRLATGPWKGRVDDISLEFSVDTGALS